MKFNKILLFVSLVLIICIFTLGILMTFGISIHPFSQVSCGCQNRIPEHYYIFFGILLILASMLMTYYHLSRKMEKRLKEHVDSLSKILNKEKKIKNNNDSSFLRFLNPLEQRIVKILVKNKEGILQSQLSKEKDLTKLKVHRAIKSLEQKSIIDVKRYGKTNKINLRKDFLKSFSF